jgi:hypothetical protein
MAEGGHSLAAHGAANQPDVVRAAPGLVWCGRCDIRHFSNSDEFEGTASPNRRQPREQLRLFNEVTAGLRPLAIPLPFSVGRMRIADLFDHATRVSSKSDRFRANQYSKII